MVSIILFLDIVKHQVLDIVTFKVEVLDIVKNQVLDIVSIKGEEKIKSWIDWCDKDGSQGMTGSHIHAELEL